MSIFCSVPLLATLLGCGTAAPLAVGYVEGEFVQLAPIELATVQSVLVRRGDRVEAGQAVVEMESADVAIAVAQAEAALAQAEAQLADLKLGKRPEEIAVLEAMVRSAKAQAEESRRVLARAEDLLKRGIAPQAQYDEASTAVEVAEAQIDQAEANLAVGQAAGPRRGDQGRREAGRPGRAGGRAGAMAACRAHRRGAGGRPRRRRHPQPRRHCRPVGAGHLHAA